MIGHKDSAILKGECDKSMRTKFLFIPVLTIETEISIVKTGINKNQW